jgi:hypothetical protein
MLLDTKTGRTWQLTEMGDLEGSPLAWQEVWRLDTPENWQAILAVHPFKKVKK